MVRTTEQKTKAWEDVDKARDSVFNEYAAKFKKALEQQIHFLPNAIRSGVKNPEDYIVETPIIEVLSELYIKVGAKFAVMEYRALKAQKYGLIAYFLKAEEPQSQWLRYVRGWISTKGLEKAKQITDTLKGFVRDVLDIAIKDGLSIDQTVKLITDRTADIRPAKAQLLARTEIVGASNLGSWQGAISTGLELEKEWSSTPGKRTRDWHTAADGQTRPLKEPFTVNGEKMQYPGDPAGSGDNVINCRCTLLYNPI